MQFLKGDCLEVMKTLPDKSIDCFICDLPFGCLTSKSDVKKGVKEEDKSKYKYGNSYHCSWDVKIDLPKFWEQVKRLAKDEHTPVLMFCTARFGNDLINSNPSWFRYDLVWHKTNAVGFLNARFQPLRSHELIYIFAKKGAYYKRIDEVVEGAKEYKDKRIGIKETIYNIKERQTHGSKAGIRCSTSVVKFANKKGKGQHPTQKPQDLYKWLLERYCIEGGTILDATAGSFNSCFAGHELGLNAIGIEKEDKFYDKAIEKLKDIKINTE
jgi:site-specific DNA-methyltransferase (adenine-specific)